MTGREMEIRFKLAIKQSAYHWEVRGRTWRNLSFHFIVILHFIQFYSEVIMSHFVLVSLCDCIKQNTIFCLIQNMDKIITHFKYEFIRLFLYLTNGNWNWFLKHWHIVTKLRLCTNKTLKFADASSSTAWISFILNAYFF